MTALCKPTEGHLFSQATGNLRGSQEETFEESLFVSDPGQRDAQFSDVVHLFALFLGTFEQIGQGYCSEHLVLHCGDFLPCLSEDFHGG
jgi:hypothetical protein